MLWLSQWLVLGTIFVSLTFSTPLVPSQSMNQQDIQILIEKAKDAWIAQDVDVLAQLFTIDGELIVPGQCWRGQERIREGLTNFKQQYSDVKIDIQRIIIGANQAAVEWYYEDTEKATGRRTKADDVIVVDFRDSQISRWREYFDTQTPTNR
ncbi:MAG: nuclear transport factor 2 family protein [Nostoc sp.]|uniref:nuclear transport factor 2 family protein n=1 Tax=Nostoc sp. TaxID=1180 RepID=UPI002FFABAA2